MLCPKCHKEMDRVRFIADTGNGESESQYRCLKCWYHETVREPRKKVTG